MVWQEAEEIVVMARQSAAHAKNNDTVSQEQNGMEDDRSGWAKANVRGSPPWRLVMAVADAAVTAKRTVKGTEARIFSVKNERGCCCCG